MSYKRSMAYVFSFFIIYVFALTVIIGGFGGGIMLTIFDYWYIGIPLFIGTFFVVPFIGKLADFLFHWSYHVK